ncbi:MAG: hypothetical protein BWY74_00049 [Firmicutes bacterium ADurb.Bin419]|nr:MAG: hypothetical protein BWY74_00049 [Firmicutes bacterium ADurb.Bin419]
MKKSDTLGGFYVVRTPDAKLNWKFYFVPALHDLVCSSPDAGLLKTLVMCYFTALLKN